MEYWQELGLLGLFLSSFLSATVIPLSSELVFLYCFNEGFSPFWIIVLASVGNVLGGMSSYVLGRLKLWGYLAKFFGVKEEKVKLKTERYRKWGAVSASLTWLPIVGDLIAVILGYLRVKWIPVTLWMTVGKTLRYLILYLFLDSAF